MSNSLELSRALLEGAPEAGEASEALEQALAAQVSAAREAWPGVELEVVAFVRALGPWVSPEHPLASLHLADLYLATACLRDAPGAIAAFERAFGAVIDRGLRGVDAADRADARARVRERLLTDAHGAAKLASYGGRGPLLHWLRITVVRMRKDLSRVAGRRRDRPALDSQTFERAVHPIADPEYAYLRGHYSEILQEEFSGALGELSPRARNTLRQHLVEGLSTAQLAAAYGVDASTPRRWLAKAREELWGLTRRRVMRRLALSPTEFESIVRLVRSELEVSVVRLLRPTQSP